MQKVCVKMTQVSSYYMYVLSRLHVLLLLCIHTSHIVHTLHLNKVIFPLKLTSPLFAGPTGHSLGFIVIENVTQKTYTCTQTGIGIALTFIQFYNYYQSSIP